jgi:NADH-quinone oxidoreductase subunit N
MVGGNLIALAQKNIKRMLAYSSIAHAGYIMMAISIGTPAAVEHSSFICSRTLSLHLERSESSSLRAIWRTQLNIEDYSGLWHVEPRRAVAMAIFMLALLGFPLFGGAGFIAKYWIIQSALQAPNPQTKLAIILVIASLISAGYYLYVVMVMFMRQRKPDAPPVAGLRWLDALRHAVAAILIIVLGILPNNCPEVE